MKNIKSIHFFILIFVFSVSALAQNVKENLSQQTFLINQVSEDVEEYYMRFPDSKFHSSLKPYSNSTIYSFLDSTSQYSTLGFTPSNFPRKKKSSEKWNNALNVIPIADASGGFDFLSNRVLYESTLGLNIRGNFGKQVSYSLLALGGYTVLPNFTDTLVKEFGILPGQGIAYRNVKSGTDLKSQELYSFANLSGYISWSPQPFFQLQLGKDKLFLGDGYRSLLLSDVSNNYPYFKASASFWKIKYDVWYSWMRDVSQSGGFKDKFLNKFGAFHYLSWNATKWLNISLFENVIWQGEDSNRVRYFDVNYLNPAIFFRPVEYALGSSDNAMMGMNLSIRPFKSLKIYSQLVLDEFLLKQVRERKGWWANKQGIQAGWIYYNTFRIPGLDFRGEWNWVRPYTYSHGSPQQSYTHFNQPLAHPLGANFTEYLAAIHYTKKRLRVEMKFIYAMIGKDTAGISGSNVGQNIFLSYLSRPYDFGHYTGQGIKTTLLQGDFKVTYLLFPSINMRAELGYIQRSLSNERGFMRQTPYIFFGIRTGLYNRYRDY